MMMDDDFDSRERLTVTQREQQRETERETAVN
jgi:hypothetical protein